MSAPGVVTVSGSDLDHDGRPDNPLRFPYLPPPVVVPVLTYPASYPAFY